MSKFPYDWHQAGTIPSASFVCGYCGSSIGSDKGYTAVMDGSLLPYIYICHVCNKPTFIFNGSTTPAAALGNPVVKLPEDINALYNEIRQSTSVSSYTAAVLSARKLLMHIAVEKAAEKNMNFVYYVDYLETNHFTPPGGKSWVDKIRKLGNDANHEITIMTKDQATLILNFLEMLLKFIYEFPDQVEEPEKNSTSI